MTRLLPALASAACLLAGCTTPVSQDAAGADAGPVATDLALRDASGRTRARATLNAEVDALAVRVESAGMAAGTYAAHIHSVGRCDAPDFQTAGPHWNPTTAQHGRENPLGAHLGDLPNLIVGANGQGSVSYTVNGAGLASGQYPVADADGAALIVHAQADDYRTDPSGNAGGRLACAVIAPPR